MTIILKVFGIFLGDFPLIPKLEITTSSIKWWDV